MLVSLLSYILFLFTLFPLSFFFFFFFFHVPPPTEIYTSFPTRRSSDLDGGGRLLGDQLVGQRDRGRGPALPRRPRRPPRPDRKSTRLNSSHPSISYAVFCLKKKKKKTNK